MSEISLITINRLATLTNGGSIYLLYIDDEKVAGILNPTFRLTNI